MRLPPPYLGSSDIPIPLPVAFRRLGVGSSEYTLEPDAPQGRVTRASTVRLNIENRYESCLDYHTILGHLLRFRVPNMQIRGLP